MIDGATNQVITSVTAGNYPDALCYNPQNNKVYCANYGGASVTVIDGATDSVLATVTAVSPWAFCYNPQNNKVYAANLGPQSSPDSTVTVIDGATNSVIATVPAGMSPWALCYNPTNNKVYCANSHPSGDVTVIDGASNGVLTAIGVGDQPRALAWNPAQNRVYVANYGQTHGDASISVLRDSMSGIEESPKPLAPSSKPAATVVRSVLILSEAVSGERSTVGARLLDISGRKVLDLRPGANDVSRLSPGVYFVRSGPSAVCKVVVQR